METVINPEMTVNGGHLANLALHRLNVTPQRKPSAEQIVTAVLYSCGEMTDLVTNLEIDEAVLRVQNAIRKANETTP